MDEVALDPCDLVMQHKAYEIVLMTKSILPASSVPVATLEKALGNPKEARSELIRPRLSVPNQILGTRSPVSRLDPRVRSGSW
jgi:hypothetical protein